MKIRKIVVLFWIIALFVTGTGNGFGEEKILLKLNLQKGKVYEVQNEVESKVVQLISGSEIKINIITSMDMRYEIVEAAADGTATIKITYTGIQYKQESPLGKESYNSADSKAPVTVATAGFAAMVGSSIMVKMSNQGKIIEVQGVDAIMENMFQQYKNLGVDMGMMGERLKKQFGDEAMKESFQQMFISFPEVPVGPGDNWNNRVTLTKPLPMITENIYKFRSRKNGMAIFDMVSTIQSGPEDALVDLGVFKAKYSVSGQQGGEMEIQESSGFPFKAHITQNLSGYVEMINPKSSESTKWPIKIESVVSYKVKEV